MPASIPCSPALTFASPAWLAALPAAMAPILVAAWGRRRFKRLPTAAVAAQCLAVAAAVCALARPLAPLAGRTALPYLLFVDRSGSTRSQQPTAGTLGFAPDAKVERFDFAAGLRSTTGSDEQLGSDLQDETDAAPVLRMIAARARSIAAAVIVTDGRFTQPGWLGPAEAAGASGAELLIVPLNSPPPDARIVSLAARRGAGSAVELTVTASANAPLRRTLTVRRPGRAEPLWAKPLELLGESPALVRISDTVGPEAAAEYTTELAGDTAITENDAASDLVLPSRQEIAVVGADARTRALFGGAGLPVSFLAPAELPAGQAELASFAALVLLDATGGAFTPDQRAALAQYARNGGGLTMIGTGPHEAPADREDPLNRVLPLRANPFQRRPLALTVLLDSSGSMALTATAPSGAEQIKFDLAAQAVLVLKDHLTPRDTLAVIAFADGPKTVYDSGDAETDFAALAEGLRTVRPNGSTHVIPAIEAALRGPVAAGRSPMLLVLSDLQTEPFDAARWAGTIRQAGARLAVVVIGEKPTAPPPLEQLVRLLGENASYQRRDTLAGLARVFAELVRQGRGEAIRRGSTQLAVVGPLFDTGLAALPDADAYILAAPDGDAEPLARTLAGDVILARRPAGLGRSVGLALPLTPAENLSWQADPDVAKLLASAVRWSLRPGDDPRFDASLTRRGGQIQIDVTATQDVAPWNNLALSVEVVAGENAAAAPLEQVAPGGYSAVVAAPPQTPAAVGIRHRGSIVWRGSAAALYPPEYARLGADRESLERLAELTGGKIVPAERLAQRIRQSYRAELTELWPWLLALAAALMLIEWSLSRVTRR